MISVLLCLGADFMTCGPDGLCKASSAWPQHTPANCFIMEYCIRRVSLESEICNVWITVTSSLLVGLHNSLWCIIGLLVRVWLSKEYQIRAWIIGIFFPNVEWTQWNFCPLICWCHGSKCSLFLFISIVYVHCVVISVSAFLLPWFSLLLIIVTVCLLKDLICIITDTTGSTDVVISRDLAVITRWSVHRVPLAQRMSSRVIRLLCCSS